ncbi:hypothetical protein Ancab_007704 [Ancistrocladus abbreviatus]
MQAMKFCLLVLLASALVLDAHCAQGRSIQRKLAKKPKGTVKTLKGDKGDVIDCVDIYKQPAFDHPLLQNHTLQIAPSSHKYGAPRDNAILDSLFDISWRKNGGCPEGSVPIVRNVLSDRPIIRKNISSGIQTSGHQHAVIFFLNGEATMQGGRATITQWDPYLAQPEDFSLSQIWIMAGQDGTTNRQTIEAGWQKHPHRTGFNGSTFFVYWTADGYNSTGCYDLRCAGWVLTCSQYSPGMQLQSSTYGGQPIELAMDIERDQSTGNWWLYLWGTPIGYWPPSIYKGGALTNGSATISWGGEIYDSSGSEGFNTSTQMGSGHFATEGYRRASYVRDIVYTAHNGTSYAIPQDKLDPVASAPNCYDYQFQQGCAGQVYFYYGGPGCGTSAMFTGSSIVTVNQLDEDKARCSNSAKK